MKMLPNILVVLAAGVGALLGACAGYTPLYLETARQDAAVEVGEVRMDEAEINVGERRPAQLVYRRMKQAFPGRETAPPHVLDITIREDISTLAVRRDASDQRLQLNLTADVTLSDTEGKQVFQAAITRSAAYNVESSPFGTDSGKDRARNSAADALSDEIIQRIALYFNDRKNTRENGDASQ